MESKSEFKPRWKLAQVLNVGKINLGMVNNIGNYDSPQKRSVHFLNFYQFFFKRWIRLSCLSSQKEPLDLFAYLIRIKNTLILTYPMETF
jgi:hypothetical protein